MVRTRTFDPAEVLERAVQTFKRHGYRAASVETLTEELGIGRGSLYATWRDKRALFMAALASYADDVADAVARNVDGTPDPVAAIHGLLREIARFAATPTGRHGCLLTNSAAELAGSDPEIQRAIAAGFQRVEDAYCRALTRAQRDGILAPDKRPRALARLLLGTMQGLRVLGKANPDPHMLRDIADSAVLALK